MRFAVLSTPDSWYFKDLVRAARDRHRLTPVPFRTLSAEISGRGATKLQVEFRSGETILNDFDAVIVRTMPPGSLEQVVFRMDVLGRLEVSGTPVVNSARAIETAVDKYLASAKLEAAGLTVPRTVACQTVDMAMNAFHDLGGSVVIKPLFGSEGRGIARIDDEALALRAFKMLEQLGAAIYVQEFIAHAGCDLRLLVVGQKVVGMRRCNPLDWRTNVSRGAATEPLEVTSELGQIALTAAGAVGAQIAGVDLLPGRDGKLYAIEVNAVPGWKALAPTAQTDVAALVLQHVASLAA